MDVRWFLGFSRDVAHFLSLRGIQAVITHGGIGVWIDSGGCRNILEGLMCLMTMIEGRGEGLRAGNSLTD